MGVLTSEISNKQMVPLCRQIATSYDAGIPIIRTLEIVSNQLKDQKLRGIVQTMRDDIVQGSTLAEAANKQRKYFPPVFINLLAGGEQGGKLDVMLRDLADYYEDRQAMTRQIVGMMIYPLIQLGLAWFLGTFSLRLITLVMGQMSARSPSIKFEDVIADYLTFQGKSMIVVALAAVAVVVLSRAGLFKYVSGIVKTYIWPISNVARNFAMARFYRSMALLTGSGLNIIKCIQNSAAATANPYIEKDVLKIIQPLQHGSPLSDALGESKFINQVSREMIRVGEESGRIESQFKKASEYCLEQAKHAAQIMTRVFGVLVSLVVACIVGYVVIRFYVTYLGGLQDVLDGAI
jgi:type IV pilus assembly protein PilC